MRAPPVSCCFSRWRCRPSRKRRATGRRATISPSPFSTATATEIGHRGIIHEDSVPVDQLPDHFVKAVLATEDRRFFEHFGIDFFGLTRAMTENVKANSVVQGGSTITQQLAKNLFLTNERTIERKVKEAFLAFWLEANLSKKEILRLYLDRAYMGGGTFGAAAAAQFYFGKDITEVSIAEAAMLAGLFKAPARYAPHIKPARRPGARQRGAVQPCARQPDDRGPGHRRAAQSGKRHRPRRS